MSPRKAPKAPPAALACPHGRRAGECLACAPLRAVPKPTKPKKERRW